MSRQRGLAMTRWWWAAGALIAIGAMRVLSGAPEPQTDSRMRLVRSPPEQAADALRPASPPALPAPAQRSPPPAPARASQEPVRAGERSWNLSGWVRDATGGAVAEARVSATSRGDADARVSISNADGAFQTNVAPAPLRLSVTADGYAPRELELSAPTTGLEVMLVPASSLQGQVLFAGSRLPVERALVSARTAGLEPTLVSQSFTDSEGRFVLEPVAEGTYDIAAEAGEYQGTWAGLNVGVADVAGPIEIEVRPSAALEAEVYVGSSACAGAAVALSGAEYHATETAEHGRARVAGMLPGPYRVAIDCPRALPHEEQLVLAPGANVRHWTLERGATINGTAETAGGEPLAGAVVTITPHAGEQMPPGTSSAPVRAVQCLSDASGRFECSGLVPGSHDCALTVAGERQSAVETVVLTSDSLDTPVLLRADPSGTILVHLEAAGREPAPAVAVFARRPGAVAVSGTRQGTAYEFHPLPLGTYVVYASPSPREPEAQSEAILEHDGDVKEVTLRLPEAGSIRGRLIDRDGSPLVDVWISPRGTDTVWKFASDAGASRLTDSDGGFSLTHLMPGQYRLQARGGFGQHVFEPVIEVLAGREVEITLVAPSMGG